MNILKKDLLSPNGGAILASLSDNRITSLTPLQKRKLKEFTDKWLKIKYSTEPCDFEMAKKVAREIYAERNMTCPEEFYLCDDPGTAVLLAGKFKYGDDVILTPEQLGELYNEQIGGPDECASYGFYDFIINQMPEMLSGSEIDPELNNLKLFIKMAEVCGAWAPYDECIIFQQRPLKYHFDEQGKLHNTKGPAIEYRNGNFNMYFFHGEDITPQQFESGEFFD